MPETSIILPTYNRASTLPRAIQSVLNQSYGDLELIVVDDASTDETTKVLDTIVDERMKVVRSSENRGPAGARNLGIRRATGRYIAFQDSDDEWRESKLQHQITCLKASDPEVGLVYGRGVNHHGSRETNVPSPALPKREGDVYDLLLFNMFVNIHCLIPASCLREVGNFDERLSVFVDWELFLRIARKYRFRYVDRTLVDWYREEDKDRTPANEEYERSLRIMYDKHAEAYRNSACYWLQSALEDGRPLLIWGAGLAGYSFSKLLEFCRISHEGFVDSDSSRWGDSLCGKTVYSPSTLNKLQRWDARPYVVVKSLHAQEITRQLAELDFRPEADYRVL